MKRVSQTWPAVASSGSTEAHTQMFKLNAKTWLKGDKRKEFKLKFVIMSIIFVLPTKPLLKDPLVQTLAPQLVLLLLLLKSSVKRESERDCVCVCVSGVKV